MALVSPLIFNPFLVGPATAVTKDSHWLTLDVCREFTRSKCTRTEDECRFAHPPPNIEVQNGRVMCCFDSIKGKCQRRVPACKYLHPPQHLKDQLLQNGRNNLIMKHMQMQAIANGMTGMYPVSHQYLVHNGTSFNPFYAGTCSVVPQSLMGGGGVGGASHCGMHPSPNVPPPCIGPLVDVPNGGGCCSAGPPTSLRETCILEDGHQAVVCQCADGGMESDKTEQELAESFNSSFMVPQQQQQHRTPTNWNANNSNISPAFISANNSSHSPSFISATNPATYCSPIYYQGANVASAIVPLLKHSSIMDTKGTSLPVYQNPSAGYRQIVITAIPYPQSAYIPISNVRY